MLSKENQEAFHGGQLPRSARQERLHRTQTAILAGVVPQRNTSKHLKFHSFPFNFH